MRPVIEKKKLEVRHLIYILIITICIIAIGIAVYMQFFKDEKLGVIFGITKEQDDEEYKKMKNAIPVDMWAFAEAVEKEKKKYETNKKARKTIK